MPLTTEDIDIEVHLEPADVAAALRADVGRGLRAAHKELSPKWFYDEHGCALFEAITRLPEYYPTRTERAILAEHADDIAALTGADTLVELGSGTSEKTRLLLDALADAGTLARFVPFDVAQSTLLDSAVSICGEYPDVAVTAVVGDFERHIRRLPGEGRRLVAFLGGTIGNLDPPARAALLGDLAATLRPGEHLLLGTDLVKDRARLVAAYDDAAGVTAAFNRNVLSVLNRELGAHFDLDRFDHIACFDEEHEWIEMRLRSRGDQRVDIEALGMAVELADGEDIRTEISAKFRPARIRAELAAAGLRTRAIWTDPAGDFALTLAVKDGG
jgi:L-histidine N-alpha-methyltransferase